MFPSTLKSIPFQAFVTCNSLHQVILPEGVTTIAETAFAWSGVTFITLPSTLTSIGLDAFYECNRLYHINNLSDFELVYGADSYGGIARRAKSISAVRDNSHMLVKDGFVFYLGEEQNYLVNYIGTGKHVVLPESVNGQSYVLDEAAFAADVSISWITYSYADIPWIIELCHTRKYVESITIPNTVAFIPAHCFTGWISIKTIYYQGTEEEWSNFVISNAGNAELLTAEVIFLAE